MPPSQGAPEPPSQPFPGDKGAYREDQEEDEDGAPRFPGLDLDEQPVQGFRGSDK